LESTDASTDSAGNLRKVDGYYLQSQFVLGRVDLSAGWGIDRIFLTSFDYCRSLRATSCTAT